MLRNIAIAVTALILLSPASSAWAQTREFVGFSEPIPVKRGIFSMHAACHATFRHSRMCNSQEIFVNGPRSSLLPFPEPTDEIGWVHPVPVPLVDQDLAPFSHFDFSGIPLGEDHFFRNTCNAWSSNTTPDTGAQNTGTAFGYFPAIDAFSIGLRGCDEVLPVACCRERPVRVRVIRSGH